MKPFNNIKTDIDNILERANKHNFFERFCLFISAMMFSALSYNLFFSTNNIVTGGSTGLLILLRELTNIDQNVLLLIITIIIIIVTTLFLGKKETIKSIMGNILLLIFIPLTEPVAKLIDLSGISLFVLIIYGSVLTGFATGIIIKTGFSQGGFQTLYDICYKYFKISVGQANRIINIVLITVSALLFGINNALYGIIALFISSYVTDRVILGVSDSKTFYIITSKEKEIKEVILNYMKHGLTIINAKGGFSGFNKKVIMCVIPTRQYHSIKEIILEIDDKAFFIASDAYEVSGGF